LGQLSIAASVEATLKAGKLKKIPLWPRTHDIELRDSDVHAFFQELINVIAGKAVKLEAGNRG
jgi:hypothetical protein